MNWPVSGVAGEELGIRPRVALRVNPPFAAHGSGMRMGGGPQQFGVDAERVPELLRDMGDLDFQGFHVFAALQNLRADRVCETQRLTVELLLDLAESAPGPVRYLNLGGGFGIPYFGRDRPLDLARVGENLETLLAERLRPRLPQARVHIELGRYLVGEAGVYVTRVVDRKESRARRTSWSTAVCTISSPPPATSASSSGATTLSPRPGRTIRPSARRPSSAVCAHPGPARRRGGTAARGRRRSDRGVPGGCLRADRQPDGVPRSPGTGRSTRVMPTVPPLESPWC